MGLLCQPWPRTAQGHHYSAKHSLPALNTLGLLSKETKIREPSAPLDKVNLFYISSRKHKNGLWHLHQVIPEDTQKQAATQGRWPCAVATIFVLLPSLLLEICGESQSPQRASSTHLLMHQQKKKDYVPKVPLIKSHFTCPKT